MLTEQGKALFYRLVAAISRVVKVFCLYLQACTIDGWGYEEKHNKVINISGKVICILVGWAGTELKLLYTKTLETI